MFLQSLPETLRWALLFAAGASLGALVNLAIYRLAHYVNRNVSPWSPPPGKDRKRRLLDRVPVLGWFLLRRESDVYGKGHWIRPLLIETAMGLGLAWYYHWNMNGGLYGGPDIGLVQEQVSLAGHWNFGWFLFHSVLITLMVVATFIDFDERLIPDWITVPGVLFALVCHLLSPALRLPYTENELLATRLLFLGHWSPHEATVWHVGPVGLLTALAIVLIWCFILLPKTLTLRHGWTQGVRLMLASIRRPQRKTTSQVTRIRRRQMHTSTKVFLGIATVLTALVIVSHSVSGLRWTTMFDALLGLAMGGGLVWAVRIIASQALGEEAMGLGDVTLMAMIGAFLGWQAALLTFVIAPFTSILVALVQLLIKGENRLAFGPYLCLAAGIVVIGWNLVWNQWAVDGVFAMGGTYLMVLILVCLVLMSVMLTGWRRIRYGRSA